MPKKVHFVRPSRRLDAAAKANYKAYKLELKEDFHGACGYCGDDCIHFEPHIDHFRPQKPNEVKDNELKLKFAALKTSYDNLVFTCPFCNRRKSNKWPTGCIELSHNGEEGFVDPCCEDYDSQLGRHADGRIYSKEAVGSYMFTELGLGLMRHQLLWLLAQSKKLKDRVRAGTYPVEMKYMLTEELDVVLMSLEAMLRSDV